MTSQRLAVRASSAAAACPRHRDHAPRCSIRQQTLGPPSPFVAIVPQFVLVHLHLGERVSHGPQFGLDFGETGEQGGLQTYPPTSSSALRRTRSARAEDVGAVIFAASPFGSKSTRQARDRPPREAPATMRRKSYRIVSAGAEQRRRRRSVAMRLRRQWRASAKLEVCDPSPLAGEGGVAKQRRMRGLARERRLAARRAQFFVCECRDKISRAKAAACAATPHPAGCAGHPRVKARGGEGATLRSLRDALAVSASRMPVAYVAFPMLRRRVAPAG